MHEQLDRVVNNIVVLSDKSWNSAQMFIFLDKLRVWLTRWCEWFLEENNILEEKKFWRLLRRAITINYIDILSTPEEFSSFSKFSMSMGYRVQCVMHITSCINELKQLTIFTDTVPLSGVVLKLDDELATNNISCEIKKVVDILVAKGIMIMLSGSISRWMKTGIFGVPSLNSSTFTILPPSDRETYYTNSAQSKSVLPNGMLKAAPCSRKMNLVVTPSGWIYPCHGLVDMQEWRVGHIEQKITSMYLTHTCMQKRLVDLVSIGPDIELGIRNNKKQRDHICQTHRLQYTQVIQSGKRT